MYTLFKKILYLYVILNIPLYSEPSKIMPLGDSITYGYPSTSGYRGYLWNTLKGASYNVDFVGSKNNGSGFDTNHEGYGGYKTYEIANIVYSLLVENSPDIILLHIGSNDASPTQGVNSSSVSGLNNILNQIDNYENHFNHSIHVILARIINRRTYHQTVRDYNKNLINLANSRIANGDKLTLVDMEYGAGLTISDFADFTHPNSSGYHKMSNVWFNTLKNVLPPPQPTNTTVSSISATSATLSWNDTSSNESGFNIYQNGILLATVNANVTSYVFTNLTANRTYEFVIKSYNSSGESSSSSVSFTTKDDYGWLPAVYHVVLN